MMNKHNFTNKNIDSVVLPIREYDMSEAGYSLLREFNYLSEEQSNILNSLPTKMDRTIMIGKFLKNNKVLSENLMNAFTIARKSFIENNNLDDNDILEIKKDALFVINKICKELEFGKYINFKMKNKYTSYYNLGKIKIYYNSSNNKIDIKGYNQYNPLFNYLIPIFKAYEFNRNILFKLLKNLRTDYINRKLPIECYREINSLSLYNTSYKICKNTIYSDNPLDINILDISYNYMNIIYPIIKILI